jgi:hypothetical protein
MLLKFDKFYSILSTKFKLSKQYFSKFWLLLPYNLSSFEFSTLFILLEFLICVNIDEESLNMLHKHIVSVLSNSYWFYFYIFILFYNCCLYIRFMTEFFLDRFTVLFVKIFYI